MAIGMTYEQYWYGDPLMVRAYYKADKLRQQRINDEAWLHGAYVLRAIDATVGNMMRKKGAEPAQYPKQPIELNNVEKTEYEKAREEENDTLFANAYMMNLMQVGKNWGKK